MPVVMVSLTLAVTVESFYTVQDSFVSNLAFVLGIPPWRIAVTDIVAGSVTATFEIAPSPVVQFSVSTFNAIEGASSVSVTVLRSTNVHGNLTLGVFTKGSLSNSSWYSMLNANITFLSQETQVTFEVPLFLDTSPGATPTSSFSLGLKNASGGTLGPISSASVFMYNTHLPTPSPPSLRSVSASTAVLTWVPSVVLPWTVPVLSPVHSTPSISDVEAGVRSWLLQVRRVYGNGTVGNWTLAATVPVTPAPSTPSQEEQATVSNLPSFSGFQFRLAAANGATGQSSWSSASGVVTTLPLCSDGARQGDEGCDDSNLVDGDGCSYLCAVELGWACTRGGDAGAPDQCTEGCGNGFVSTSEGCDDGGTVDGDGCSGACTVEAGWLCSRPSVNSSAPASVCRTTCGDGVVAGTEGCDAGPLQGTAAAPAGTLGCAPNCTVAGGYSCTTVSGGSVCSRCGNGVRERGEGCEDGATLSGDGCSDTCSQELGWTCSPSATNLLLVCSCGGVCGIHCPTFCFVLFCCMLPLLLGHIVCLTCRFVSSCATRDMATGYLCRRSTLSGSSGDYGCAAGLLPPLLGGSCCTRLASHGVPHPSAKLLQPQYWCDLLGVGRGVCGYHRGRCCRPEWNSFRFHHYCGACVVDDSGPESAIPTEGRKVHVCHV